VRRGYGDQFAAVADVKLEEGPKPIREFASRPSIVKAAIFQSRLGPGKIADTRSASICPGGAVVESTIPSWLGAGGSAIRSDQGGG